MTSCGERQAEGGATVLISTELDEVIALSTRIAVLYEGRIVGIVPPDTPRETLGLMMGGKAIGWRRAWLTPAASRCAFWLRSSWPSA